MTCFYLRKSVFIQLCEWRHKNPWNQGLAISCDLQWLVCLLVHTSLTGCVARCWQCQGCKDFYEARPTKAQCVIPVVLRGNKLCIDSLCVFRCHIIKQWSQMVQGSISTGQHAEIRWTMDTESIPRRNSIN